MKAVKALAIVLLAVFCVSAVSAKPRHHRKHHYKHHVTKKYHKKR